MQGASRLTVVIAWDVASIHPAGIIMSCEVSPVTDTRIVGWKLERCGSANTDCAGLVRQEGVARSKEQVMLKERKSRRDVWRAPSRRHVGTGFLGSRLASSAFDVTLPNLLFKPEIIVFYFC